MKNNMELAWTHEEMTAMSDRHYSGHQMDQEDESNQRKLSKRDRKKGMKTTGWSKMETATQDRS